MSIRASVSFGKNTSKKRTSVRQTQYSRPSTTAVAENDSQSESAVLSGLKPVLELLESDPGRVDLVLIRKGLKNKETDRILDCCRAAGVRFNLAENHELDRLTSAGHQGVAARLFSAGFMDFDELLQKVSEAPLPLLVALDQVQDPGNAGTLARTLYAMGCAGLVVLKHNSAYLGAGARRAAAGALERLPVARVTNLARALESASEAGLHIYGTSCGATSVNALTAQLTVPAVLVLGSEEHGPRELVLKRCETLLSIPMARSFDSLNVAQAGAILVSCFSRAFPTE